MSNSLYTCNCDVIHEDIVNDVKAKCSRKTTTSSLHRFFAVRDGTRVQILHALEQSEMCMRPGSAGRHQIGDLSPAESTPALPDWSNSAERPRSYYSRWRMIM